MVVDREPARLSFEADIRPLFTQGDRTAMLEFFDLWSFDDVVRHGAAIAERLADGSLPRDIRWSDAHVSMFDRWRAEGANP
ncbi:hypothetical protein [Glaciihabitans sp. dw_435]|uniref:hypothetical protein n=1 Tax=Glaciihabitans sp. dw_435 TaxID=2720081 RepID=UPI001BD220CA|nr:hypothetical protein [Glaciihabitans sp. dw_435]